MKSGGGGESRGPGGRAKEVAITAGRSHAGREAALAGAGSAEFRLAAACCRPPGPGRDLAVRAAAAGVDWARFGRVLSRHRVEGLAREALWRAGVSPDPALARDLKSWADGVGRENLRMAAETGRLQALFDEAGVPNLVLKGAAMDRLAWGRLGLKHAWDIDLLVTQDQAPRARALLEAAGYDLKDPPDSSDAAFRRWIGLARESVFRGRQGGFIVELHWRLTDSATLLVGLDARAPSQPAALSEGLVLRTLADAPLFAYLSVHGTSHAWSRLKWLADLCAFLAHRDEAGRARLYREAQAFRAGHCLAVALLLCETLFGLDIPAALAGEIRADRKAARLAALAMDALTGGGGETDLADRPMFQERILLSHFQFDDGWRHLWSEFSRQSVSVDDHMRLRLPAVLGFVYPAIRAPLWLWRRLGRGARALRSLAARRPAL